MEDNLYIKNDTVVQIAYKLTVDGELIEDDVMEYLHGHENIIPGLESQLFGLKIGDERKINVKAVDAYGDVDPQAIFTVDRETFPADFEIQLGVPMRLQDETGHSFNAVATAVSDDGVELDLNHPLAGKDLDFEVRILDIRFATAEEIDHGHLQGDGCSCGDCDDDCGCSCSDGCCH